MSSGIKNRIGNYHYADGALRRRVVDGKTYIIGIAGAYNAYGLIGSECNGIFILDDTRKQVVLDEHLKAGSGYSGPSKAQWDELQRVAELPREKFIDFMNSHPRYRRV